VSVAALPSQRRRRTVTACRSIVLVGFGLKPAGFGQPATHSMKLGQPAIAIGEEQMCFARQLWLPPDADKPDKRVR